MTTVHKDLVVYKEILEAAATRIEKPGAWTRGALARGPKGNALASFDAGAVCWCAVGAIGVEARARSTSPKAAEISVMQLSKAVPRLAWSGDEKFLSFINDDPRTTQETMVTLLRTAAARIAAEAP